MSEFKWEQIKEWHCDRFRLRKAEGNNFNLLVAQEGVSGRWTDAWFFACKLVPHHSRRLVPSSNEPDVLLVGDGEDISGVIARGTWDRICKGFPCPHEVSYQLEFPDPPPRPMKDWEKKLAQKFPRLYPEGARFSIDKGWAGLIEECSREVLAWMDKYAPDLQVGIGGKQKYARLELYIGQHGEKKHPDFDSFAKRLEKKYGKKSEETCEICGGPGEWAQIDEYWECILCPEHSGIDPRYA